MAEAGVDLQPFHAAATRVWHDYRQHGPGATDANHWCRLQQEWDRLQPKLIALDGQVAQSCQRAFDLCGRCAESSVGLNFVTGESGLVPRLDLHQALDEALRRIDAQVQSERR